MHRCDIREVQILLTLLLPLPLISNSSDWLMVPQRVLVNHNAMRAFVYISVTLWARGSHFVWPRKWRQQLIKVTEKRKQKRTLHCG
jgi:hypothetical protein